MSEPERAAAARLLHEARVQREVACAALRGARLATAAGPDLISWRWTTGVGWTEGGKVRAHRYGVTALQWSSGGALLASVGVDGAARTWSLTLDLVKELVAPCAASARVLCWAGARLLVGHDDGAVCIWLAAPGRLVARIETLEDTVRALATLGRGELMLVACAGGVLKVFDLPSAAHVAMAGKRPEPVLWLDGAHDLGALCAASSDNGQYVATGGQDARVALWELTIEGCARAAGELIGHGAGITAVSWAGTMLASASLDRTARLWEVQGDGSCLLVVQAHSRYLTCVLLDPDMRFFITGSNDRTIRTWTLNDMSLVDYVEPPCTPHAHFGVGDLEGIGPVEETTDEETVQKAVGVERVWEEKIHNAAINCIATVGAKLATAGSDGVVKLLHWDGEALQLEQTFPGEWEYPALAVDLDSNGLALGGGLAGAALWPVSGEPRILPVAGVRGARLSPHDPPMLLLALDDGRVPVWSSADVDPAPFHIFSGHNEAAMCCAWRSDGELLASGGEEGELRLHAAPPNPGPRACCLDAHELGIQTCDFAPMQEDTNTSLATGGCDGFIRLWTVSADGWTLTAGIRQAAHGGGVNCVRWGGVLLASGGVDRWTRVWRVSHQLVPLYTLPVAGQGGAPAVGWLPCDDFSLLIIGSLYGDLELWRLPEETTHTSNTESSENVNHNEEEDTFDLEGEEDEYEEESESVGGDASEETEEDDDDNVMVDVTVDVHWWGIRGVTRWLRDYVTRIPGEEWSRKAEQALIRRVQHEAISGTDLIRRPLDELLAKLGGSGRRHSRLAVELKWLRECVATKERDVPVPHALLCPVTHRPLRDPVRAADGCTYERAAAAESVAAAGAVSPMWNRRMLNTQLRPNHRARAAAQALARFEVGTDDK